MRHLRTCCIGHCQTNKMFSPISYDIYTYQNVCFPMSTLSRCLLQERGIPLHRCLTQQVKKRALKHCWDADYICLTETSLCGRIKILFNRNHRGYGFSFHMDSDLKIMRSKNYITTKRRGSNSSIL